MNCRARLRRLIDSLEARYRGISEDSTSLKESQRRVLETNDDGIISRALSNLQSHRDVLGELLAVVEAEAYDLRVTRLRMRNLQQHAVSLPDELLAQIFELSCLVRSRGTYSNLRNYSRNLRKTRNAIMLTCWAWQQTARRTSALWSMIMAEWGESGSMSPHPATVSLELERAAGHPLSLHLITSTCNFSDALSEPLLQSIPRCALIHISIHYESNMDRILFRDSTTSVFPNLRTLILTRFSKDVSEQNMGESRDIDIASMPSLRDLRIVDHYARFTHTFSLLRAPVVTTNGIVRLHITGGINPQSVVKFINACSPTLEILYWSCPYGQLEEPLPERPQLSLAALNSLWISGRISSFFLRNIDAPKLEYFGIDKTSFRGSGPTWVAELVLPAPSTFPNLRYLDARVEMPDETLSAYLESHPHLEQVRLSRCLNGTLAHGLGEIASGFGLDKLRFLQVICNNETDVTYVEEVLQLRSKRLPAKPFELRIRASKDTVELEDMACVLELEQRYNAGVVLREGRSRGDARWDWAQFANA